MKKKIILALLPLVLLHAITWLPVERLIPQTLLAVWASEAGVQDTWEIVMIIKIIAYAATWGYGIILLFIVIWMLAMRKRRIDRETWMNGAETAIKRANAPTKTKTRKSKKSLLKHTKAEEEWLKTGKF